MHAWAGSHCLCLCGCGCVSVLFSSSCSSPRHTQPTPHPHPHPQTLLAKNKRTARTVWYKAMEQGGLVYIFPDAMRAGAIEQHVTPFLIPEHTDPAYRVVQGTAEIRADAHLVRSCSVFGLVVGWADVSVWVCVCVKTAGP